MTKLQMTMTSVQWKMDDAMEDLEECRSKIEREMKNFNPVTSPEYILDCSQKMVKAWNRVKELSERKRMLEDLAEA